ncbi:hypothetical protein AMECASPLE_037642 [Ameca splendens]|uniref:Uncharacterized protein n=1 Tax=Ameca splendens TaxID=208324 RepID=A0ABV0Y7U4_9TELE
MTRETNRVEIKVTELFTNHRMLQCFRCVSDQSVAEVNKANQVVFSQASEDHLFISRGYKAAADNRTSNSVCAEHMSVRYTAEDAVELIFSDVQQDNSDSEEEVQDVSEEEERNTTQNMMNHLQKKKTLKLKERLSFQKMAK